MECYLDNSATTPVCDEAAQAVSDALLHHWGNPSSLYRKGMQAEDLLQDAREAIAERLNCRAEEIFFTSGGTESNNIAVLGTAAAMRRYGSRVVISSIEHSSVEESARQLEAQGLEVVRLPVGADGKVSEQAIFQAVNRNTILVSLMAVNNEVGSVQPVQALRRAVRAAGSPAVIHCDAVQAFGKLPSLRPGALGVDLMSVSAHKIHGPKGVGALYVRGGYKKGGAAVRISPRTFGGLQEGTLRPGTEPVPAIAGFGAAVRALPDAETVYARMEQLRSYLLDGLCAIDGITVNSPADALPYIVNISTLVNSEPMMNFLSRREIYVSSGSACSKGHKSRVLRSMGLNNALISSALRISFSHRTTTREIDLFLEGLAEGKRTIRTARR
ncbi:MAG: cysteine desulfurase [Clostridia bacterium]|nr:cysteine desulfurase [Clostridia bacterium]